MNFESFRIKQKKALVDHAFRLYPTQTEIDTIKSYWLNKLLDGRSPKDMLDALKEGSPRSGTNTIKNLNSEAVANFGYSGSSDLVNRLEAMRTGIPVNVKVSICNLGNVTWFCNEKMRINASYHWLASDDTMFIYDGVRTPLPHPIPPNTTSDLLVMVIPPTQPGTYKIQFTLVHEGVCWFEQRGFRTSTHQVEIERCQSNSSAQIIKEIDFFREILSLSNKD